MAYLACADLVIGYGNVPVASGISFSVNAGEMLCVVGENGAGKSTLIKTLLGLIPPIAGMLEFGDGLTANEVGYLPQRSETQRDFPASAWEVALSGRLPRMGARPFFGSADKSAALLALERVDAAALRARPFGVLSGGQQQRVLLARALSASPRLLVLDEPTTGLDPDASASLYRVFDGLIEEGTSIVVVTHDVAEALEHATHVLAFNGSTARFSAAGSSEEEVRHG